MVWTNEKHESGMESANAIAGRLRDNRLYGSWRVVGAKGVLVDTDGNRTESETLQEGALIFTPEHRMIAFVLRPGRKPPRSDDEKLELFTSMVTYSGKFKLELGRYVLTIDWSSTALNQGEPQIRYYTIDGDTLTIEVPLHNYIHDATKRNTNVLTLMREK
jgi:hypothetical protein